MCMTPRSVEGNWVYLVSRKRVWFGLTWSTGAMVILHASFIQKMIHKSITSCLFVCLFVSWFTVLFKNIPRIRRRHHCRRRAIKLMSVLCTYNLSKGRDLYRATPYCITRSRSLRFLPNYRANVAFTTSPGYWEPLLTLRVLHWLHYVVVLFRLRAQGTPKRGGGATWANGRGPSWRRATYVCQKTMIIRCLTFSHFEIVPFFKKKNQTNKLVYVYI